MVILAEVFLPDRQAPSLSVNQQEVATMARTVNRSARSGRFVSKASAARWPSKTVSERVGRGTSNTTQVHRSASTGRFATGSAAKRNPGGTIGQRV